jgi:hypothetical protein
VQGQSLRRLLSDTRKFGYIFDQILNRSGVVAHLIYRFLWLDPSGHDFSIWKLIVGRCGIEHGA